MSLFYATLLATLLLISRAYAASVVSWTNEADFMGVATCVSLQDTNEVLLYHNIAPYKIHLATFHVLTRLKGEAAHSDIVVKVDELDVDALLKKGITTFSIPEHFWNFLPKQNYLLFLKKDPASQTYSLVSPYRKAESEHPLDPLPAKSDPSQPLNVQVLAQLLPSLSSADESIKMSTIEWISGYGILLEERGFYGKPVITDPTLIREQKSLAFTVSSQAVPMLLSIAQTGNEMEQAHSLAALAELQVVSVIPALVGLASSGSSFSNMAVLALGDYRTDAAAPLLAPLVIGQKAAIKKAALYSLGALTEPSSIPFLVKALNDPDPRLRYSAVSALYMITGEMSPVAYANYLSKETQYKKFWKSWKPALKAGAQNTK